MKNKQKIMSIIRVAVSIGIIAFFLIFQQETIRDFIHTLKQTNLFLIFLATLGYIPVMAFGILRWDALLKVQEIHLSPLTLIRLCLIGLFFNNFTLGVTGGDLIKAYYVSHETENKKTEAVTTVFLDRIIGMFALFSIALVALFFTENNEMMIKIRQIIFGLFLGGLLFCVLLFSKSLLKKIPYLEKGVAKLPFLHTLKKIFNAFHLYHHNKMTLVFVFVISIILQACMMLLLYFLGYILGIKEANLVHYFLFFPIIATLSALPISLGGLGVGEFFFVYFFGLIGVPEGQALALALCMRFILILWGMIGGLIYMLPSTKINRKQVLEEECQLEALELEES